MSLTEKADDMFDNFFQLLKAKESLGWKPCSLVKVEKSNHLVIDPQHQVVFSMDAIKEHGEEASPYVSSGLICVLIDVLTTMASAAYTGYPHSVSVNLALQVVKKIKVGEKMYIRCTYLGRQNLLVRTRMTILNGNFEECYIANHIKMEVREKL